MLTGDAIPYFRMAMQLVALRFKVETGRNAPGVRGSIVAAVKREYGLKGTAAQVLAAFEPMVQERRAKQVHVDRTGVKP